MAATIAQMSEAPTAANIDAVNLQISLAQMLDLALRSPEVGAVNFNILHNFLHILLHQINLEATKVEFHGENADRIKKMVTSLRPSPFPLQLDEYNIIDAIGKVPLRIRKDDGADADVLAEDFETVPETQMVVNGAPTALAFKELEQSVKELQQRYRALEEELSPEVIEGLKDKITDPAVVSQFININERLDANEQGIDKLTKVLQDVIKGDTSIADTSLINARLDKLEDKVSKMEEWLINLQIVTDVLSESITPTDVAAVEKEEVKEDIKAAAEPTAINDVTLPRNAGIAEIRQDVATLKTDVTHMQGELQQFNTRVTNLEVPTTIDDVATLKTDVTHIQEELQQLNTRVTKLEEPGMIVDVAPLKTDVTHIQGELQQLDTRVTKLEVPTTIVDVATLTTDVTHIQEELQQLNTRVTKLEVPTTIVDVAPLKTDVTHIQGELQQLDTRVTKLEEPGMIVDVAALKTKVTHIQGELQQLNTRVTKLEEPGMIVPLVERSVNKEPVKERPNVGEPIKERPVNKESVKERPDVGEPIKDKEKIIEVCDVSNLKQCLEAIKNVETTHDKALNDITQRVVVLETEIEHLLEKVDSIKELDRLGDVTYTNKLVTKMKEIETDMEKIGQVIDRMFDDKEKQDKHINTLLEQIELLKIVKANKEDLEDALAEKADAQAINRKVSHDQFDAACNNLARGLEEAIDKLTKQELIWQQALDEVQNEIATKMNKDEMTPLKDFVNNKLKSLQEKLKIIIEARREIEAAGTKKLLRDVQCISCDKDVVMKTEEVNRYRAEPLPCTTSLKPYLTYELDKVRKQQRRLPHSRNMIQFEAVMQKEIKKKAKEEMLARTSKDHLCNRYCGGSHTITTPQQRVLRTGHFLTQWGPEAIQLTDGLIRGKDGQMYHSRPMSGKDVCGLDCCESQFSEETGLSECASTTSRKPLPSQRHSAKNQKRNSRKQLKEPKISESEKKLIETHQMTSPQENDDRPLVPAGLQNEITLFYRPNNYINLI